MPTHDQGHSVHGFLIMTAPSTPNDPSEVESSQQRWSLDDERAALRRQQANDRAVRFSSVLSAVAITLGAALSAFAVVGPNSAEDDVPSAPVDPLALVASETMTGVSFEKESFAAVAIPALDLIRYPWRSELQGWTITFLEPRGRASGYTWSAERRMEVFISEGDDPERIARVLAHEIGHAIDVTLNSPDERREWLAEREASDATEWWPGSGRPDFETGAGDFAEVFATTQVGRDDFKSKVNPEIDDADIALLNRLILRTE